MRLLPILSLILMPGILAAQKLDGVFVGELITAKNALVLTTRGENVNGNVFLTEYEKFTFMGNIKGDSLKGVILVPGGAEVVLMGKCFKDSISATLHSNEDPKRVTLRQLSSKANYNLARYFGDGTPERDPLLIGKWYLVKALMPDGSKIVKRKYFYDYQADGVMKHDMATLKANMEESWRKAGGKGKLNFDERLLPRTTWRTSGGKLISTSDTSPPGIDPQHEYTYQIKDDTLTLVNFKGGKEIMVRERKKN